jgi:hypothetical protein
MEGASMTDLKSASLLNSVWDYPLFEALYGRRSRRFGLGFEIEEGPFRYRSEQPTVPLSEFEEALLVAAGIGVTGIPLWDGSRPPAYRGGDGRTFASTAHGRRTALFFTNDSGLHVIGSGGIWASKTREIERVDEREKILGLYQQHRRPLSDQRLEIPRRSPPLFGHNMWDCNMAGSTLFMPVSDVSATLIALILNLVDGERGRYVRGHGGGMNVVDDRHGFRPAGTEPWLNSGFIDKAKILPLSILERQACYFMFSEPAVICHNIFLATEAMGIGGWMHCGFLSLEIMQALGFRMTDPTGTGAFASPVGLDGVLEGYCPPYYRTMSEAVDTVVARMSRKHESAASPPPNRSAAHMMADTEFRDGMFEVSDEGIACAKAVCNYIYENYGRFPASVDAMHLMLFMQAHHLDLDYYAKFFHPGACGRTHEEHMNIWHPRACK